MACSPRYQQRNDFTEATVNLSKNSLETSGDAYKTHDYRLSLLKNSSSLVQMLTSQMLGTTLPATADSFFPQFPDRRKMKVHEQKCWQKQKTYSDVGHGIQDLPNLYPDINVQVVDLENAGTLQQPGDKPR